MRDLLSSTLKHRYLIERELGKGGIGSPADVAQELRAAEGLAT